MTPVTRVLLVLVLSVFVATIASLEAQQAAQHDSTYVVAEYDPERNPTADLELAVARASAEQKRILIVVGGDWCLDCLNLDWVIGKTPTVEAALRRGFLVLKVNVSRENWNKPFLAAYPDIEWVPQIFVLESDGSLLHSQDTRELQLGRSNGEQVFLRFLERWTLTRDQSAGVGLKAAA